MSKLLQVSLRQKAIFIPAQAITHTGYPLTLTTGMLITRLARAGYSVTEELLSALNSTVPSYHAIIAQTVEEALGLHKNWTPLVKGWNIPTGESVIDHLMTLFSNIFQRKGTTLPCGHIIPSNTFPLERYNGCPFCGTPFNVGKLENFHQGSAIKVLELWTDNHATHYLRDLLASQTALDATQTDSLKILLSELPLPDVAIRMKETVSAVVDILISQGKQIEAARYFSSPADILRYLWYKHTGCLQIVEPKTIIRRKARNSRHAYKILDKSTAAQSSAAASLKLKYSRRDCMMVATWMNNLKIDAAETCELMHPKRGMWVRFIRALRLAEYSKRKGFEKLQTVMHKFYNSDYEGWNGKIEHYRIHYDACNTFHLLQQHPGMFARSLFANMLWFGHDTAIPAFATIIDKVPARLVFTLDMYADNYFDPKHERVVKPLGGVSKNIPVNNLLKIYSDTQLKEMKSAVRELCILAMMKRFKAEITSSRTIYIDPVLYKIPVSIGDRSDNVQDESAVLTGTRFTVEGDTVRLFMQWGNGLAAQHLDMDLSCWISYEGRSDVCSYMQLTTTGCRHSGDIRSIPHKVGTAEYIDVDIDALQRASARYVTFTCNAYSEGSISPNLIVGWMNSMHPMKISEKTGVAYDSSCVQHQVRITNALTKGLAFGVLDVQQREIIWLEIPFQGQIVQNIHAGNIEAMIRKLDSKLSIGRLLEVKAEAQQLQVVESLDADEVYTRKWAANHAAVTKMLID